MATSKLGVLCLVIAITLLFLFDVRILLTLGFLYYAYKLLYKKEKLGRADNIIIILLIILILLELFSLFYLSSTYDFSQTESLV